MKDQHNITLQRIINKTKTWRWQHNAAMNQIKYSKSHGSKMTKFENSEMALQGAKHKKGSKDMLTLDARETCCNFKSFQIPLYLWDSKLALFDSDHIFPCDTTSFILKKNSSAFLQSSLSELQPLCSCKKRKIKIFPSVVCPLPPSLSLGA